jgi:tetratricopeptide (TPR) repeat protein
LRPLAVFGIVVLVFALLAALNVANLRGRLFGRTTATPIPSGAVPPRDLSSHPNQGNSKAREDLLEGRIHASGAWEAVMNKHGDVENGEKEFAQGISLLKQAIQEDPNYAPACVELAKAIMRVSPHRDLDPEAEAVLLKALALDESNPSAHLLLARLLWFGLDWDRPEIHYRRAIQLAPDSADGHEAYAEYLDDVGRFEEGMKEHQKAQALDQDNDYISAAPLIPLGVRLERKRKFMQTHPPNGLDYWMGGEMEFESGRHAEALKDWEGIARDYEWNEEADAWERAYAQGGPQALIVQLAKTLDGVARDRWFPRDMIIDAHRYAGDHEGALTWLKTACNEHDDVLRHLRSDYRWDPYRYRCDPRFVAMLHCAGLAP